MAANGRHCSHGIFLILDAEIEERNDAQSSATRSAVTSNVSETVRPGAEHQRLDQEQMKTLVDVGGVYPEQNISVSGVP
jgi:hypothetical protein